MPTYTALPNVLWLLLSGGIALLAAAGAMLWTGRRFAGRGWRMPVVALTAVLFGGVFAVASGAARERGGVGPSPDPAAARMAVAEVEEARAHYARILPLIRNLHNPAAAAEMIATADHLDRAVKLRGGATPMDLTGAIDAVRATGSDLAARPIGVPPGIGEALEVLRTVLDTLTAGTGFPGPGPASDGRD